MTMLSFRIAESEAAEIQYWAQALGVHRSEILRDAVHRHLVRLCGENDAARWARTPATEAEASLAEIADWAPPKIGRTGTMQRGEIWFAAAPGGDRPVLVPSAIQWPIAADLSSSPA